MCSHCNMNIGYYKDDSGTNRCRYCDEPKDDMDLNKFVDGQ